MYTYIWLAVSNGLVVGASKHLEDALCGLHMQDAFKEVGRQGYKMCAINNQHADKGIAEFWFLKKSRANA